MPRPPPGRARVVRAGQGLSRLGAAAGQLVRSVLVEAVKLAATACRHVLNALLQLGKAVKDLLEKHLQGKDEKKDAEREKAREEARKKLEDENNTKKAATAPKPLPEFGSSEDFQLAQALNRLKGKPVMVSKTLVERKAEAEKSRASFPGCDQAMEFAKNYLDVSIRNLGRVLEPELPPEWKPLIEKAKGGTTGTRVTERGVEYLAICNQRQVSDDVAAEVVFRAEDLGKEQQGENPDAAKYLEELRSKAQIVLQ